MARKKPTPPKFKFGKRSLSKLEGVDETLVAVAHRAIELTEIDFGIGCGLRTPEEQAELVASGKSQTMNSRHLTGHAVDVVAYELMDDGEGGMKPQVSWDIYVYDDIADAFANACRELGVTIRWGGAWHERSIANGHNRLGNCQALSNEYCDIRRAHGRRPFIDGVHFEIPEDENE